MIYLHVITGNALAFKGAMAAWGRKAGFFFAATRIPGPPGRSSGALGF